MTHLAGADRIRWQIPEDYPELLADEHALTSVLYHLLDNAIKYAPQGDIILTAGVDGGLGWIRVEDQGEGIPDGDIPLLFIAFSALCQRIPVITVTVGVVHRSALAGSNECKIEAANRLQAGPLFTCWLPRYRKRRRGGE
jgi:K+-sensing histidine kinase KdpD